MGLEMALLEREMQVREEKDKEIAIKDKENAKLKRQIAILSKGKNAPSASVSR